MSDSPSDDRILPGQAPQSPSAGAKGKSHRRRLQRLFACAIAVCAVALIAVSASFLFVSPDGERANGASAGALADEAAGSSAQSAQSDEEGAALLADAEAGSVDADAGASAGDDASASAGAAGGAGAVSHGRSALAASESPSTLEPDASPSGSSPGAGSADAGSSREETITVTVTVTSSAAGGSVSGSAHPTFAQGATAYDALCATGLSVNAETTAYGIYVTSIGGLAQKEHGGKSGWMFSVNGTVPMASCGNYVLHDGDNVQWYYVV